MKRWLALCLSSCLALCGGCAANSSAARAAAPGVREAPAEVAPEVPPPEVPVPGADAVPLPQTQKLDAPPSKPGACPKPARKIQSLFANAFKLASQSAAKEPQRAIAEAIRLRLDELFQSGCGVRLTGKQLNQQVSLISEDPALREHFGVMLAHGYPVGSFYTDQGAGLALYAWRNGQVRTRIVVTHDGVPDEQQLLLLDVDVFQPPGAKQPMLAILNTHPWMSSCWRTLRMRVLEPSGVPAQPTALLDRETSGRWCEDTRIRTEEDVVSFSFSDWYSVFKPLMVRTRTVSYRYADGALKESFGFAAQLPELMDDWLISDWALAKRATLAPTSEMERTHQRLGDAVRAALAREGAASVDFTLEVFPDGKAGRRVTVYCALSEDDSKACSDWPKPVDVFLERRGGHWLIREVRSR